MTNETPALAAHGLTQSFGARSVLGGVDLQLHRGEVLAVVGASGCGKSTLLYALARPRQPDGGTVAWATTPTSGACGAAHHAGAPRDVRLRIPVPGLP